MANSQIAEYLKFVNLQMAAESFLHRIRDQAFGQNDPSQLAANLAGTLDGDGFIILGTGGNGRSSRFTRVAAEQFANDWEVLAHKDNAPSIPGGTGFSGTLFRAKHTDASKGITAGELVLSFRSTEFIDDYLRDNAGSNALELKDLGWTFGQIKEMEDWYKTLRQDQNLLGGKTFSVTGYSLGGELATAFNILRRDEEKDGVPNPVVFTMTFNGAGTGGLKEGNTLSGVMANFRNYLKAVASPDLAGLGFSGRLTDSLIELLKLGNQTNSAGWRDIKGALEDAKFSTDTSNRSLVLQAMKRVETLVAERNRVAGLKGIVLADGVTSPTPGDQFDLGYQVAALLAARGTIPSSVPTNPIANQVNFIPYERKLITPDNLLIQNMAEVYGSDGGNGGASFVSFSGLHYGKYPVPVYIEDQPLFRGNILSTFANLNVPLYPALLVDDPASNDFGDTHSLALLVDSLSTMQAMSSLDPNLTAGQIEAFFKTMSNSRKANFPKTQGRSEGDTLEFMLNAMGDLFGLRAGDIGPDGKYASGWQEMKPSNAGNTWFELGNYLRDGVGYTGRELFHRNLQLVNNAVQQTSTGPGIQPFSVQSLVELRGDQ